MRAAVVLVLLALPVGASAQGASARTAYAQGKFVQALTAHYLGNDSTAVRVLDDILSLRPDDPAVLDLRAEVALAHEGPASALFYADRTVEVAPRQADGHLRRAEALLAAGRTRDAARALEAARDLAPDRLDVLLALADVYGALGDGAREAEVLETLVQIGDTVAARLRLSALYEAAGNQDRALTAARAASRLAPAEPAVRQRLAALAGAPAEPAASASSAADGAGLYAAGRYAEAADALLDALADDPRDLAGWALALEALARTADPRAGATADDALLLFPTVPAVLAPAAEAYAAAGRRADAVATAQRGLDTLDALGDRLPDADALRVRFRRTLDG